MRKSKVEPGFLGPDFFLADIVFEAGARPADVAGQGQQENLGTVGEVIVEIVVGAGPLDDAGRLGCGKLMRDLNDQLLS